VKKDVISVALKGRYPPPQGEALCIIGDKKHPPWKFSRDLNKYLKLSFQNTAKLPLSPTGRVGLP